MKTLLLRGKSSRHQEDGMASLIVIVVLATLLIYIMGNVRTLHHLGRELQLIEKQQERRVQARMAVSTNQDAMPSEAAPTSK